MGCPGLLFVFWPIKAIGVVFVILDSFTSEITTVIHNVELVLTTQEVISYVYIRSSSIRSTKMGASNNNTNWIESSRLRMKRDTNNSIYTSLHKLSYWITERISGKVICNRTTREHEMFHVILWSSLLGTTNPLLSTRLIILQPLQHRYVFYPRSQPRTQTSTKTPLLHRIWVKCFLSAIKSVHRLVIEYSGTW